jgi:hypothetical protein
VVHLLEKGLIEKLVWRVTLGVQDKKTRQEKTRQNKTAQDSTRKDKTRQDKASQETRQDKRQDKTTQDTTRQETTQDNTRQHKTCKGIQQQLAHVTLPLGMEREHLRHHERRSHVIFQLFFRSLNGRHKSVPLRLELNRRR